MEHIYQSSWTYKGKTVIECETCGYKHLYPKPTQEELNDFYIKHYHTQIKYINYDAVDENYIKRMEQNIDKDFDCSVIFSNVSNLLKIENRNMLDLGCGNNLTSILFKKNAWNSYIIEPNEDAYNYILKYGVKGYNCFFEDMDKYKLPQMAFINARCVLEHVMEPVELIEQAHSLLEKGGIFRIAVPNDFSEAHLAYMNFYKRDAGWICYPDHINYFNHKSLEKILTEYGFEVVHKATSFPLVSAEQVKKLGGQGIAHASVHVENPPVLRVFVQGANDYARSARLI